MKTPGPLRVKIDNWQAGCRNATLLWRDLVTQGYHGSRHPIAKWVSICREAPSHSARRDARDAFSSSVSNLGAIPLPSAKHLAWLLVKADPQLSEQEQDFLDYLRQSPVVTQCWNLAQQFLIMLRQRLPRKLRPGLKACYASGIPKFIGFADGLTQDRAAIHAALSQEWSNGQLEGQPNRLKCIQRQMYGRAKFDLLRIRVLSGV